MYQNIYITHWSDDGSSNVYLWDDELGLQIIPYYEFNYAYVPHKSGKYTSIYGHSVAKVKRWAGHDLVFESDVPRETRVLTDLYIDSDEPSDNHIVGNFDIEVDSEDGFPNVEIADKEITSIAFHNSKTDKYNLFVLDHHEQITDRVEGNVTVNRYTTEYELLTDFLDWYTKQKFTILTGWNIAYFDIPYLYRRLSVVLDTNSANMLSPVNIVKWRQRNDDARYVIAGVSCLDYLEMYKKFTYSERPNYRLGTISMLEIGKDKYEFEGSLAKLFKEDIHGFIQYSLTDVVLVKELDDKLKLIELVRGICHVGHVPYEDYPYSSKFIEGTIITYLHRKNIICPNKPFGGRDEMERRKESGEEGFTGAFVKDPVTGLHDWVFSLDIQSLYPSIIMSLNISPETKCGRVLSFDMNKHLSGKLDKYQVSYDNLSGIHHFNKQQFLEFLETEGLSISSNGILYNTKVDGIIPEILDNWFSERAKFKALAEEYRVKDDKENAEYYDRRQHVQKIFLNSVYGALGLPIFRFYDLDNALAVTSSGQDVIKTSAKYVNTICNKAVGGDVDNCIYIDTDSLFFSSVSFSNENLLENKTYEENLQFCIDTARTVEKQLNMFYNVMTKKMFNIDKHRIVIKGETIAKTALWVVKKRYAMMKVYDLEKNKPVDNKIVVKGLDTVRSSFPPAFNRFMSNMLKDILSKVPKEDVDKTILQFKKELPTINYLEIARNISIKDLDKYDDDKSSLSFVKFKTKTPAHVKAGIAYNRLLTTKKLNKKYPLIRSGDKIKYAYLKTNPYQIDALAVKGFEDPPEIVEYLVTYIDHDKLFDKELRNKLTEFYHVLGWGLISTDVNQTAKKFLSY